MIGSQADQWNELAIEEFVADFPEQRPILGQCIVVGVDIDPEGGNLKRVDLRSAAVLIGTADHPMQRAFAVRVYAQFLREHLW